jgi:hypothetical protein
MESCQSCGAALTPASQWCGQCYAVVGAAPAAQTSVQQTRPLATASLPPTMLKTRWKKTGTTFGPLGRIIATLALVVPFLVFVALAILTGGLILAAPVIWGFVIMPWGLRDTWKAGLIPAS